MTPLRTYEDYVDSGLAWLDRIPAHWQLRPLGTCFDERRETVSDKQFPPLSVTMNGIVPQLETAAKTNNGDNRKRVARGDFVINSRSDRKGSAGLSDLEGSVSLISTVLTPRADLHPKFVHHLLRSRPFQEEYYRFGTGIVADLWSTRYSSMKRILLPVPPLQEQQWIASYLDTRISRMDELIAKQEQLLVLLTEKRQAVVTQAVTKGLNPSAPTKQSGIPWLGDVPAHWTIRKFTQAAEIKGGQVDPRIEPWASTLLIAPNHVESGTGRILYRQTASEQGADSGKYRVNKGDVIYSKIRPYLRKVVIAPVDCLCSADMYAITGHGGQLSNRYLQELMLSQPFTDFTADSSARVAMPKINRESLAQGFLWYPPTGEQEQILHHIDRETHIINEIEEKASNIIRLLKERRSALISAAVTGKIDVREGAV